MCVAPYPRFYKNLLGPHNPFKIIFAQAGGPCLIFSIRHERGVPILRTSWSGGLQSLAWRVAHP